MGSDIAKNGSVKKPIPQLKACKKLGYTLDIPKQQLKAYQTSNFLENKETKLVLNNIILFS